MPDTRSHLRNVALMIRGGHLELVWRNARKRAHWNATALGLRCDLTSIPDVPPAKVAFSFRPLPVSYRSMLVPASSREVPATDFYDRAFRLRTLDAGIGTCYGALDPDGRLCYVQWLITPDDNDRFTFFGGAFEPLAADECLLEGAYTFPPFRGLRIMARAVREVLRRAREQGYRHAVTYVAEDNAPSLAGCRRLGFRRVTQRAEQWRFLRHRYAFSPLDVEFPADVG